MHFQHLLLATTLSVAVALAGGSAYAAGKMNVAVPSTEVSAANAYVSVFGGYAPGSTMTGNYVPHGSEIDHPLNSGYVAGVAVGTHLLPNLRGEVELSYVSKNVTGTATIHFSPTSDGHYGETGSMSTLYLLGNLWYDIDLGSGFAPYFGGGLGVARAMPSIVENNQGFKDAYTAPAAQVGAGIRFAVTDHLTLDLGYRAKAAWGGTQLRADHSIFNVGNVSNIDQTVQVGLSLGF